MSTALNLKPDLSTPDGLRAHTLEITRHLNELQLKQQKGRFITEDEWNAVDGGLRELAGRTQTIDEILKTQASSYPGPNGEERFLLDKASLRLDTPEEMPRFMRTYFNVAVMRWDEIASLAHLGSERQQNVGLSEDVARAASSTNSGRLRDRISRFQTLNDELLVTDVLLHPAASRQPDLQARLQRMRSYKKWPEYTRLVNDICDAMKVERAFNEGTATAGADWVPTVLSAQLMDLVQVWSRVAPLFTPITMTSKTLDWPVLGSDLTAYIMLEASTDATDPGNVVGSQATTNKVQFVAKKFGVRTFASAEVIEDSVVAMVPFIIQNCAKVLARGIEDCIINGDTAGTMDGAWNAVGSVKRGWMGLRQHALVTTSYPAKKSAAGAATAGKIIDLQYLMGAWGASPAPLAYITGFHGLKSLMQQPEFLTLEKFGPQATILTGQIGAMLGSPVVVSEFVTEKNASGVHDNATPTNNDKGSILCVHRESYGLATRRGINVNGSTDRYIELDQVIFVATARNDFKAFYAPSATVTPIGILYNIT